MSRRVSFFPRARAPRLAGLDGLRGLAILVVVFHNAGYVQTGASSALLKLIYFARAPGWIGVQLFFVLSGFLITGLLADASRTDVAGSLRSFWIRRALRIFPLYYAALFLGAVVAPHIAGPSWPFFAVRVRSSFPFDGLDNQVWYWTYLCNWVQPGGRSIPAFGHFWSLAVEEQFYLVWPLVVLSLERRTLLRVCLVMAAVALLVRVGLLTAGQPPMTAYQFTFARMDALSLGAATALVVRNPAWLAQVAPRVRTCLLASSSALCAMWGVTHGFDRDNFWVQTIGYGVLSVFFAALILEVVLVPASRLGRWLSAGWLRWFGKYSYGIYVFHGVLATILGPGRQATINGLDSAAALRSLATLTALVLGLSILAALVSWNVLERWMLELKDRLAPPSPGQNQDDGRAPRAAGALPRDLRDVDA